MYFEYSDCQCYCPFININEIRIAIEKAPRITWIDESDLQFIVLLAIFEDISFSQHTKFNKNSNFVVEIVQLF